MKPGKLLMCAKASGQEAIEKLLMCTWAPGLEASEKLWAVPDAEALGKLLMSKDAQKLLSTQAPGLELPISMEAQTIEKLLMSTWAPGLMEKLLAPPPCAEALGKLLMRMEAPGPLVRTRTQKCSAVDFRFEHLLALWTKPISFLACVLDMEPISPSSSTADASGLASKAKA